MKPFQWDHVRLLLALLRAKNLEEAAAELSVDRSTISRRLTALEHELGVRLFARTRDGIKPTSAALRLRPLAHNMEAAATALSSAATAGEEGVRATVRVATTEAMAGLLVSEGLLSVTDQHPELVVELLCGNQTVGLGSGAADISLRVAPVRDASLKVRCIARFGLGLFAAPSYLDARSPIHGRAGLMGQDVLLPTGELARLPEARWLAARKGVRIVFRSNSLPALVAAALAGRGLVALGLSWATNPGLRLVLPLEELPRRPLWLVTRAEDTGREAVRVVSERIAAILGRAFSSGR